MKVIESNIIYDNPMPHLASRQSVFPYICQRADGVIVATHSVREAFESVRGNSCVSFSSDGGRTWTAPKPMFDKSKFGVPVSESSKAIVLPDGRLIAIGYGFFRENPELPLGNAETGGLLDDVVFYSISEDGGETWGEMIPIECAWGPHVEASAQLTVLKDGTLMTPITGFPGWDGKMTSKMCGRALVSRDMGKTWNDDVVCMDFGKNVTCYEQRICQLESGTIICIGWNEDTETGERLENHYTVSLDGGKTFSKPMSTGIRGQASSVCAIGGEKFIAIHAIRRDTDRPGIYGYIVDFSNGKWDIVDELLLWEPSLPVTRDKNMAEIFAFLKFGQPSAIKLADGDLLMCHWFAENGQYKTLATRIQL